MNGVEIQDVDNFEYLGAYVSKEGGNTVDMNNRITKARTAFIRLKNVWSSNNISRNAKLRLYKSIIISENCVDVMVHRRGR